MKKKGIIVLVAVLAVVVLLIGFFTGTYNNLVERYEGVETAQSDISTQLQRRADLIPNFVETVKGYSDYEQETYLAVTEARSSVYKASGAAEQQEASDQLEGAISVWVNAITEAYPELKASEQYRALQYELAGTESRIAQARRDYNKKAKSYNVYVRSFPRNLLAGMFGFEKVDYFEAAAGSENAPQVSFDD